MCSLNYIYSVYCIYIKFLFFILIACALMLSLWNKIKQSKNVKVFRAPPPPASKNALRPKSAEYNNCYKQHNIFGLK